MFWKQLSQKDSIFSVALKNKWFLPSNQTPTEKIKTASWLCYWLLILVMFLFKLFIPKNPVTNSDQFSRTYLWECSPWCFLLSSLLKGPGSVLYCFVGVEVEDIFYVISHIFIIFYPNFLYYFVHKNKTVKRSHSWSSFWKARKVAKHYIVLTKIVLISCSQHDIHLLWSILIEANCNLS